MDWENLKERTLGEVGTALVTEGAGVSGGFLGAAFIGRQVQNYIMPDGNIAGNISNAAIAWGANNIPKLAVWYLTRKYAIEPGEGEVTPTREAISDARKAFAGSVVFDTIMRLTNGGQNPAIANIMGWQVLGSGTAPTPEVQKAAQADIQRLIQENSALRAELNKALQRLATQPAPQVAAPAPVVQVAPPAQPPVQVVQQPVAVQQPQPMVVQQAQPAPSAPPVVRYTPVVPHAEEQPRTPVARPVVKAEEIAPAPITQVIPTPQTAQPVPPVVVERQRKYGFMQGNITPPQVQERQKRYGFMGKEEKDIAAMFGML